MLVLHRNAGERIRLTGGIVITLLRCSPQGGARIGIEAPAEIEIVRDELSPQVSSSPADFGSILDLEKH